MQVEVELEIFQFVDDRVIAKVQKLFHHLFHPSFLSTLFLTVPKTAMAYFCNKERLAIDSYIIRYRLKAIMGTKEYRSSKEKLVK